MIEVLCAKELGETAKRRISEIFVEVFGPYLSFFSKDKNKLAEALEHMFVPDVFHVAVINGKIAGMAACTDSNIYPVNHDRDELRKRFGIYKGTLFHVAIKREFQKPIRAGNRTAVLQFFTTDSKERDQEIAAAMMNYFLAMPQYDNFILEVADTNTRAIQLYEQLGFKEFERIEQKYSRLNGLDCMVYMKYSRCLH